MKGLLLAVAMLWASSAWATPLTYELVAPATPELAGTFTLDDAQAQPFTAWNFQYVYPTATLITGFTPEGLIITTTIPSPILGETWTAQDPWTYFPTAHALAVTNGDAMTLTYQLCAGICSDTPNTYAFDVLDHRAGLRYSGWGFFVDALTAPVSSSIQSVPEPSPIWWLTLALAIGIGVSYVKDVLRVLTSAR